MLKTNTYRVHFIGRDAEDGNDGQPDPIIRNKTWEELLDEKLNAGAQFIHVRWVNGYTELSVREPVAA
ncbi:hypothetical protein [Brevundimonas sp.]|uniref:hypothetical protein n=1 Tax=Brevundimonas sp. TaxID=1871086 RepID=UPI0028AC5595|nr:hypothetical protein [Brevundimonas sp.]